MITIPAHMLLLSHSVNSQFTRFRVTLPPFALDRRTGLEHFVNVQFEIVTTLQSSVAKIRIALFDKVELNFTLSIVIDLVALGPDPVPRPISIAL